MNTGFDNKFEHNFAETITYVMENNVKYPCDSRVETGYSDLDKLTKGFRPAELTILAGRPAMGKTSFWINAVRHMVIKSGLNVGIFLAKEEAEKLANMFLASESHVDIKHIESGRLSKKELNQVEESAVELCKADIAITTALFPYDCIEFEDLYYGILQYAQTYSVDIIIIDSLQYISLDSANNHDKYIEIVKALRELAITCRIPIVLISNLPAAVDSRTDKHPKIEDLWEYGHIDQYADTIVFMYRDEYYDFDTEKKGIVELNVDRCVRGDRGLAEILWLPQFMTFANLERS